MAHFGLSDCTASTWMHAICCRQTYKQVSPCLIRDTQQESGEADYDMSGPDTGSCCPCAACCTPPLCALVLLQMSCAEGLPAEVTEELLENDDFLQKFHHALLQVSPKP